MINIKAYLVPKKNVKNTTVSQSTVISNASDAINNFINDWFYYDAENNAVVCRYDFYSVGNVAAYADVVSPSQPQYISDGLVFNLDGINKGSTADAWTDLIGGLVFTNNGATAIPNGWMINNSSTNNSLRNETGNISWSRETSTIEVVYATTATNHQSIFTPKTVGAISFGMRSTGYPNQFTISNESSTTNKVLQSPINIRGTHTVSINYNCGVIDINNSMTVTTTNAKFDADLYNEIGARASTNTYAFNGNIYAIRIYNRLLTEQEMAQNQRVDNVRFNLGL